MYQRKISECLEIFKQGGIVIFPTDTAFGIGCRIDRPEAVQRLFEIRKRDPARAVPVLVSDPQMAYRYWAEDRPALIDQLVNKYWPGALTIIFKKTDDLEVHQFITGGGSSIGIREPDQEELRNIIRSLNVPVIGTSANFPGEKTPHRVSEISSGLLEKVDYVLDLPAGTGESTVVDVRDGLEIVRQGNVGIHL
jgi:L-threonylcarbamoyladenylate synthase